MAVAVPWLSYVPIPGTAFVAVWTAPDDPLTRYHAWQGGVLVAAAYLLVIGLGFLVGISDASVYQAIIGFLALAVVLALLVAIVWGIVGAARRRYVRIRPVWDVLAATRQ